MQPRRALANSPWVAFAVGLGLRLVALAVVQHLPLGHDSPIWRTGPEMVNVGASIADHHGFSSPFGASTGPTAWLPPVYPYILAGIFRIAGVKSNASGVVILVLQAFFSAAVCILVHRIATEALDPTVAAVAAWTWALFPYAVVVPVLFIWETSMSAFLLVLAIAISMQTSNATWRTSAAEGVLWGTAALTNTALLSVMPFALLWRHRGERSWSRVRSCAVALALAFLMILPWTFRNWRTFDVVMPIRSNFFQEFWLGNHEGGTGRIGYGMNAIENPHELERYRHLGEIEYEKEHKREALRFIAGHPSQFARWSLYRAAYWWFGLGENAPIFSLYALLGVLTIVGMVLACHVGGAATKLLCTTVIVYPLVYYFTDVYARYRYPVEPLMTILTAYALVTGVRSVRQRRTLSQEG